MCCQGLPLINRSSAPFHVCLLISCDFERAMSQRMLSGDVRHLLATGALRAHIEAIGRHDRGIAA
jgi:hypothetical protein